MRHGLAGQVCHDCGVLEREQRARVSDGEMRVVEHLEHDFGKLQQSQRVGDGRTIPADGIGHILLREFEFRDQALVTARLVHR